MGLSEAGQKMLDYLTSHGLVKHSLIEDVKARAEEIYYDSIKNILQNHQDDIDKAIQRGDLKL